MNRRSPLTTQQRRVLGRALALRREQTVARIASLTRVVEILVLATQDFPDDEHDPDGATIGFERAQATALLGAARAELLALDDATQALTDGTYGFCRRCRRPIGFDRLKTLPDTTICIECASGS